MKQKILDNIKDLEVKCYCGSHCILRETKKILNKKGKPNLFWGCSRWPACDGAIGAHQHSGKPFGFVVDPYTKKLRIQTHEYLDHLWMCGNWSRKGAYKLLARLMEMPLPKAHIGMFTAGQCMQAMKALEPYVFEKELTNDY